MRANGTRVVVDALAARFGGAATPAVQVARHLARHPEIDEVFVVTRRGSLVAEGLADDPVHVVTLRPRRRGELLHRVAWEALVLPRLVRQRGHVGLLTWSGMLPRVPRVQVVSYLANALVFSDRSAANRLRRHAVQHTARRATHVVVPSRALAEASAAALGRPAVVVPLAIDHELFTPGDGTGDEVICVGDFYRHKRHDLAIAAWSGLEAPRPVLRLVGDLRVDPAQAEVIRALAARHAHLGKIVIEPRRPLSELVPLYRRARVFLLPTEQESFCLPLLEAQACGVACVVRDLPALRETGGAAATYVTGDDPGPWTEALRRLLEDAGARDAATARGIAHASTYSWMRTAGELARCLLPSA